MQITNVIFPYFNIFAAFTGHKLNLDDDQPYFASPIQNISVPIGREATLSCIVNNLGSYKIGWMKSDQTVLALATKVVTQNSRFMVAKDEPNIWKLKIKSVKPSDRGCYMCQINTSPLQKQIGCIDIHGEWDLALHCESNFDFLFFLELFSFLYMPLRTHILFNLAELNMHHQHFSHLFLI